MFYQPCWDNIAQEYCLVSVVQRHQTTLHNEITCTLLAQSTQIYFTGKPAFLNMPEYAMPVCLLGIVCKGVPAPPLYKAPTPCISLAPLFKNLWFLSPLFFPPSFRVFQTVSLPSRNSLLPWSEALTFVTHNKFKQLSKGWFYQFICCCLSKVNFWFFKSLYKYIRLP